MTRGQIYIPPEQLPAGRGEFWGFDPDLRSVGWCQAKVSYFGNDVKVDHLEAGLITAKQRDVIGLEQTCLMADRLSAWPFKMASDAKVIIEGQEFYADSRVDANDLLRLAQVTGQLQIMVTKAGIRPEVVLPKIWKGNKGKDGMHARARAMLPPGSLAWEQSIAPSLRNHAWDAVCMALWNATREVTNRYNSLLGKRAPL